jgi:cation diffusion facilitator family transporter
VYRTKIARMLLVNTAKTKAAAVSIASNTSLVIFKLAVGILSGSVSIISEAIHSANDLLAAIIAYFSVRISDRPADSEHPFGHGKAESISGVVEAALIVFAAIWIVVEAVKKIILINNHQGGELEHLGWGTAVMIISVVLNTIVARYLFKVAKKEDSVALEADAHHLSTDVYTSLGVAAGLVIVWITDWHIVDPIVAIMVAALIFSIGWKLTVSAGKHLMDASLPESEVAEIEKLIKSETRIVSWHRMRTRKSGSYRHIDFHIVMPAEATLVEAHHIADELEKLIDQRFAPANVVIHVDPFDVAKAAKGEEIR